MNTIRKSIGRDQIVWFVLGGIFVIYAAFTLGIGRMAAFLFSAVVAITVHECAHAWAANQLGDPTARLMGRMSLNPLVHLDPLGSAMMLFAAIGGVGIGWGKPVPVNPTQLRFKAHRGQAVVALSGPISNLLVALIFGTILRMGGSQIPDALWLLLSTITWFNVTIAIFNLLPLPPLDGFSVLRGLLSFIQAKWVFNLSILLDKIERTGPMVLFLVLLSSQILGLSLIGILVSTPSQFLFSLFTGTLSL